MLAQAGAIAGGEDGVDHVEGVVVGGPALGSGPAHHDAGHGGAIMFDIDTAVPTNGVYHWVFVPTGNLSVTDQVAAIKSGNAHEGWCEFKNRSRWLWCKAAKSVNFNAEKRRAALSHS